MPCVPGPGLSSCCLPIHEPAELNRIEATIRIDKLLREIGLSSSGGEANRKLREGAVSINGVKHREMGYELDPSLSELTIQLGKKWAKIKL